MHKLTIKEVVGVKEFVNNRNYPIKDIRIDRALATGDIEWFYTILNSQDNGYTTPKNDKKNTYPKKYI